MADSKNTKITKEIAETKKKQAEQVKTSLIANRAGQTEEVVLGKGTGHELSVTLRYPGTIAAAGIIDGSVNRFDNFVYSAVIEQAIDAGVIVSPAITDLTFFDTHHGFIDLANAIISFLTKRLN
ncbi:hypothetical protein SAMN04487792_1559 [Lactobacillus bombicola]|uniref:Uncharacterized protein n=1 Tax=Lactobacillus bombicola TaxID=1505723 RepID=A0A1I1TQQ2_9LACO|nr:hypothetical protein [Lactobacillus bombicola]SFD60725.1 hypothetical protein SAMN04487792_1559 [Lactobacillus bombicola]